MSAATPLKVTITGLDKIKSNGERLPKAIQKQVGDGIAKFALRMVKTAVNSIQSGGKSGHIYGNHQASAPGEAPAQDTGNLASHIGYNVDRKELSGEIFANTPYAARLEFGDITPGKNGTFIEARPFMQPALEQNSDKFLEDMIEAYHQALEES